MTFIANNSSREGVSSRKSFVESHPHLLVEWHPTMNAARKPFDYAAGTSKKVWWQCKQGHEWEASVGKRSEGQGCPVCSGRKVVAGVNDFATAYPALAAEWHPQKNAALKPTQYTSGSKQKVWWQCAEGHEWQSLIQSRVGRFNKNGRDLCPGCSGRMVVAGVNDFATTHPLLAAEWNQVRNKEKTPQKYSHGSREKVWWRCSKRGHEWEAIISSRANGNNCPVCANKVVVSGANNFSILFPTIKKQWHPIKNSGKNLDDYTYGSKEKVWWQCELGHEWEAIIADRTRGSGCPYCSGNRGITGVNDIFTTHPHLARELHAMKNDLITLSALKSGSGIKVWWQCEKGHEWEAVVASRSAGNSCPRCSAGVKSSHGEKELAEFLTSLGVAVETSVRGKLTGNTEIDIYLPDHKIGIEFNGIYWHSEKFVSKTSHKDKYLDAKEHDVTLYQIWEDQWVEKKELIKTILAHKVGVSSQAVVGARKTKVVEVSNLKANAFLENNHIQGSVSGSFAVGLKDSVGVLLAVMSFKRTEKGSNDELELTRYATSARVVGGFTKLLTYVEQSYHPKRVFSFSDNCISNGELYRKNGFVEEAAIRPDYMYVVGRKRKHKFGYRLKRFETDSTLMFDSSMTEKELAELNGLNRIWDAGKIRWVKNS